MGASRGEEATKQEPRPPTRTVSGRESISLVADTTREIGKHAMESPAKADETMLLPLAQKMGKGFGRCASRQVRTELMEGLGNTYGFHMARKGTMVDWLTVGSHAYWSFMTSHSSTDWCDGIPRGPRVNSI